ncbi:hypothetical protein [Winogradskyella sp. PG-2]|uniref:hypothetical protein n=1 Tax=Winogradskyella sp. PG-2 TaxID=754409 RepID=UPI0004585E65|nr:hypothetical protein [Winogradskyella sp. PG-2]BAO76214.1 hypothetical protein WPG_1984 [Winogradskyella sp. PG-2]
MKIIKERIQLVSNALIVLILFQSCRVYQRENVSLDKAVTEHKRVKIKTKDGQILKFKRILLDNSQFYGVKKVKGKYTRVLIQPNDIQSLRRHNKTMSIIYGTGIGILVSGFVTFFIIITSWNGPSIDGSIRSPN